MLHLNAGLRSRQTDHAPRVSHQDRGTGMLVVRIKLLNGDFLDRKTFEHFHNSGIEFLESHRQRLVEARRSYEQAIDETSKDTLVEAGYSVDATERAKHTIESWQKFIEDNKDQITALQMLYNRPYGARDLTFTQIKELADTISRPPHR